MAEQSGVSTFVPTAKVRVVSQSKPEIPDASVASGQTSSSVPELQHLAPDGWTICELALYCWKINGKTRI